VHVRDPAVTDPDLVTVDHPLVAVLARAGAEVADVAASLGLGHRERRELQVARLAEALGRPAQELIRRGRLRHPRQRQRGHHDREPDAGAAPEQLLHEQWQREADGVADQVAVEERVVETLPRGLLEHRPGELLALVVVLGHRPDHLGGEAMCPLHQVVVGGGEPKVEAHRSRIATTPWPPAAQIEIRPRPEPFSASIFASEATMRPPVAANGCPAASEPPLTLSLSRSMEPSGLSSPRRSRQNSSDSHALSVVSTCEANASWIS